MVNACIHIDTRVGPLGLPARTGLLTAHAPTGISAPAGASLYARRFRGGLSSHGLAVEVCDDLLVGAARFGG